MRRLRPLTTAPVGLVTVFAVGTVLLVLADWRASVGFMLGSIATWFHLVATWLVIRLSSPFARTSRARAMGVAFVLVCLLAKLPVFIALVLAAYKLGDSAVPCFAVGMLLVYCGLVCWALAREGGRTH